MDKRNPTPGKTRDIVKTFVFENERRLTTNVSSRVSSRDSDLEDDNTSIVTVFLAKFTTCGVFDPIFKREMANDVIARLRKFTFSM
jgi:hypothetical protein